jgi:hypothetical protein
MLLYLTILANGYALPARIEIWQHGKCGFLENRVAKQNQDSGVMSSEETILFVDALMKTHEHLLIEDEDTYSFGLYKCLADKELISSSKWQEIQNNPLPYYLTKEQLQQYAPPDFTYGEKVSFREPSYSMASFTFIVSMYLNYEVSYTDKKKQHPKDPNQHIYYSVYNEQQVPVANAAKLQRYLNTDSISIEEFISDSNPNLKTHLEDLYSADFLYQQSVNLPSEIVFFATTFSIRPGWDLFGDDNDPAYQYVYKYTNDAISFKDGKVYVDASSALGTMFLLSLDDFTSPSSMDMVFIQDSQQNKIETIKPKEDFFSKDISIRRNRWRDALEYHCIDKYKDYQTYGNAYYSDNYCDSTNRKIFENTYGYDKERKILDCGDWYYFKDVAFFDTPVPKVHPEFDWKDLDPRQFSSQSKEMVKDLCFAEKTSRNFNNIQNIACSNPSAVHGMLKTVKKQDSYYNIGSSITRYESLCGRKLQTEDYTNMPAYREYRIDYTSMMKKALNNGEFFSEFFSHGGLDDVITIELLGEASQSQNIALAFNSNLLINAMYTNATVTSKEKTRLETIKAANIKLHKPAQKRFNSCVSKAQEGSISKAKYNTKSYFSSSEEQDAYINRQCSSQSGAVSSQSTYINSTQQQYADMNENAAKYGGTMYEVDASEAYDELNYRQSNLEFCQKMATAKGCYEYNNPNYNFEEGMKMWRNCDGKDPWCW